MIYILIALAKMNQNFTLCGALHYRAFNNAYFESIIMDNLHTKNLIAIKINGNLK